MERGNPPITAGVLLAAGRSRRFGEDDKLLADLGGAPLVTHAAGALRRAAPDLLIGVVRSEPVAALLKGFDILRTDQDAQSASLRVGVKRAMEQGADRCVIVLGDMPFVTADHLRAILSRAALEGSSATTDGRRRLPPACFDGRAMAAILKLDGDRGAAPIIGTLAPAALVHAPAAMVEDVDTPADLAAFRERASRAP